MTAAKTIPRWRGFNLLNYFISEEESKMNGKYYRSDGNFSADEIKWIADWGFNFIRIPMCYRNWLSDSKDMFVMDEIELKKIDRVIELGNANGLHVSLNIHRAPGYCINTEILEPFDLFKDELPVALFNHYWETFAKRYKSISGDMLSFDLLNEPPNPADGKMCREDYVRVMKGAIENIRKVDPDRIIMVEGLSVGTEPVLELTDTGAVQSCRAYAPFGISHYKAEWVQDYEWQKPVWPGIIENGKPFNQDRLEEHYKGWADLKKNGVAVHCGEGGAYIYTPHDVVLSWFEDVLKILTKHDIGYSLWEFSGEFGILDSGRADVQYEDWHGRKLDRAFLELLRRY
ncbi:MAG TPA: cellulase family glycosylhydrolase [Spirochaetota bacterium]|nr:cellulase family glycosylhydrolase [Spirochaetota bacterium]